MCVIIIKDKKKTKINKDILLLSSIVNPHGLGVIWLDTWEQDFFDSNDYSVLLTKRPYIAHFRYATMGATNKRNTHPFHIKDSKYLFQNGTNYNLGNHELTDTEHLAAVLSKCSEKVWGDILEMTDSRYCIVDLKNKKYDVYNKSLWYDRGGVSYSKNNVLDKQIVAVYGTLKEGGGNYYNYLQHSIKIGKATTKEKYPMIVNGLPYVLNKPNKGHHIDVELFAIDKKTLEAVDELEQHPNWYYRKQIPINLQGVELYSWLYFNDTVTDTGVYHKSFEVNYNNYGYLDDKIDYENYDFSYMTDDVCPHCGEKSSQYDYDEQAYFCFQCNSYIY